MRRELPLKASLIRVENSPVPVEEKFVTSEKDVIQLSQQCYKANTKQRPFLHKRFQCDGNKGLILITGCFSDYGCALYFFLHVADVK